MSEEVLFEGKKKFKVITLEFQCSCGREIELRVKEKSSSLTDNKVKHGN